MSIFDAIDRRFRSKPIGDTWGSISQKHAAPVAPTPAIKDEDGLDEGDPCPDCERPLSILTRGAAEGTYMQLGCKACDRRVGPTCP